MTKHTRLLLILALSLMGAASCIKDSHLADRPLEGKDDSDIERPIVPPSNPDNPNPPIPPVGDEIELKASLSPMTKTALQYSGKLVWEEGDAIAVELSTGELAKLTLLAGAGTSEGIFRYKPEQGESLGTRALYPWQDNYEFSGSVLGMTLPESYSIPGEKPFCPLLAHINSEHEAVFEHLFGMVRISLGAIPSIGAKVLISAAASPLSGACSVDFAAEKPVVTADAGAAVPGNISIICAAPEVLGAEAMVDIPLIPGLYEQLQLKVLSLDEAYTLHTLEINQPGGSVPAGGLAVLQLDPCIPLADFEREMADITIDGEMELYAVVDNPFPTETNSSPKVLFSKGIAGSEGMIGSHRINLNPTTGNSKIPNIHLRSGARAARVKMYAGEDAGKYIPWGRIAWKGYSLPTTVNGQAATAENIASLFKKDDWNILVWDYTTWGADPFVITNFDVRPFRTAESADNMAEAEGERKIYFDDFQLLF